MNRFIGLLSLAGYMISIFIFVSFALVGSELSIDPAKAQLMLFLLLIVNMAAFVVFAWVHGKEK